jgi:hypothetical protein
MNQAIHNVSEPVLMRAIEENMKEFWKQTDAERRSK